MAFLHHDNFDTELNMRRARQLRLGDQLVGSGLISVDQLHEALSVQQKNGGFLGDILVSRQIVVASQLAPYLEELSGFPFIDVLDIDPDPAVATLLPESFVNQHLVLPVREINGVVTVAMAEPQNLAVVDEVKSILQRPVIAGLALATDLQTAIARTFNVRLRTKSLLENINTAAATVEQQTQDIESEEELAPVVQLVNSILSGAIAAGASDIHIEPQETVVRVRYRIDGGLYEQMTMDVTHLAACASRLKVMSGMDIAEKRRPQDGRFSYKSDSGKKYDARVSSMPTVFGEKMCLRLLEDRQTFPTISELGFLPKQAELMTGLVNRPHGLVLVTGPTGSGKSTTLYALLNSINDSSKNINTVEDPVEYKLKGINQVQVNPKIGLTFASGLRTLVRQDPDVILVGEIRDTETAEIAVQAALTGHLVLSSLHTNDAPGALVRLQNMGIEPYLISSAVIGIMGQRLVRCICPHCKVDYKPSHSEALALGLNIADGTIPTLARGEGCRRCGGRGMQGRSAAVEVMGMSDQIRESVLAGRSTTELKDLALREGMITMLEAGLQKALQQLVPPSEIIRVFSNED